MKTKKGYAYFVELALAVIIVFIVLSGFLESEQTTFNYKQNQNLRWQGFYLLDNLNHFEIINSSNFTKVETYIYSSINEFTDFKIEYYNESGCYPINNGIISSLNFTKCPTINATTNSDIVSSFYTHTLQNNSESIRIYLWRKI